MLREGLVFLKKLFAKHLGFEEADGIIEQFFVAVFSAVSYTHLDVYKRQSLALAAGEVNHVGSKRIEAAKPNRRLSFGR